MDNLLLAYRMVDEADSKIQRKHIERYKTSLAKMQGEYEHIRPSHSRNLTIPNIFRKTFDENFLSDYLAYILDPQINGIGITPLKSLIKVTFPETDDRYWKNTKIYREYALEGGRIDILIVTDDETIIGI